MKPYRLHLVAMVLGLAISAISATAMQAHGVSYEQVRQAMDAAEAEATRNGWRLTIVFADSAGVPIYLRRMPGATPRSYDIAMAKVRTALTSRMHTVDYAKALAEGKVDTVRGGVTFEGGLLVRVNGVIVGAMTASGARGAEDAQAVKARA